MANRLLNEKRGEKKETEEHKRGEKRREKETVERREKKRDRRIVFHDGHGGEVRDPSTIHSVHWLWANWDPAHSAYSASVAFACEHRAIVHSAKTHTMTLHDD